MGGQARGRWAGGRRAPCPPGRRRPGRPPAGSSVGRARRRRRRRRRGQRVAAARPAAQAAPKPRRGSTTTVRRRPGDVARAVGRAVVDHDRPVAVGHAAEHPGQGLGLVEHGEHEVDPVVGLRVRQWSVTPRRTQGAALTEARNMPSRRRSGRAGLPVARVAATASSTLRPARAGRPPGRRSAGRRAAGAGRVVGSPRGVVVVAARCLGHPRGGRLRRVAAGRALMGHWAWDGGLGLRARAAARRGRRPLGAGVSPPRRRGERCRRSPAWARWHGRWCWLPATAGTA